MSRGVYLAGALNCSTGIAKPKNTELDKLVDNVQKNVGKLQQLGYIIDRSFMVPLISAIQEQSVSKLNEFNKMVIEKINNIGQYK